MFNLLVFIGLALIILGLYIDSALPDSSGLNQLRHRIENIENILYNNDHIFEDDEKYFENTEIEVDDITFKSVMDESSIQAEKIDVSSNTLKAFEVISLYEDGKKTLEEVCKTLNMKKGEVLLLKNLYKKYQE